MILWHEYIVTGYDKHSNPVKVVGPFRHRPLAEKSATKLATDVPEIESVEILEEIPS